MKEFCLENSMEFIVIPQIKDAFIDQFKTSIFENFTLAINLILNSEKTFSNSISNNLVKSHLIEYMNEAGRAWIKNMSHWLLIICQCEFI